MFRKHYKKAYDKIEPNREIIDKVFEKAEAKKKAKIYTFAARYAVVAAVLVLVVVSVKLYPVIVPSPVNERSVQNIYVTEEPDEKQVADVESTSTPAVVNETNDKAKGMLRDVAEAEFTSATNKEFFVFEDFKEISENEEKIVHGFLTDKLGEKDEELGHIFSFGIVGKTDYESNNYYLGRWSWLVDGHLSLLCEFILSEDMNQMYEVLYKGDKIVPLYENPLF